MKHPHKTGGLGGWGHRRDKDTYLIPWSIKNPQKQNKTTKKTDGTSKFWEQENKNDILAKLDKMKLPEISGINEFGQNTQQEHVL